MTGRDPAAHRGREVPVGLAGMAELRREVGRVVGLPGQVGDLARVVGDLAEQVLAAVGAARVGAGGVGGPPSWLVPEGEVRVVQQRLAGLARWVGEVYLRYADAVVSFPECWLWHPDVVEELLCLMTGWQAAYEGPGASAVAAGEWHERFRPGVVRRIKTLAGTCSLESHPQGLPGRVVPLVGSTDRIARWWAWDRGGAAPEPSTADFAAAAVAGHARRGDRR